MSQPSSHEPSPSPTTTAPDLVPGTERLWFYTASGRQVGPVGQAQLRALLAGGQIGIHELVWTEGMSDWADASTRPELLTVAHSVPHLSSAHPAAGPGANAQVGTAAAGLQVGYTGVQHAPLGYYSPLTEQQVRYAGFWLRFAAWIIDYLIGIVAAVFVGGCIGAIIGGVLAASGRPIQNVEDMIGITGNIAGLVVGWLYSAIMESSRTQATLGKMACGLRVTTLEGSRISFGRATGRYFAKILSGLTLLVGFIMAGFTEKRQALHDMIASTLVIRK